MASRFFVPPDQIHNQKFTLLGSEARHAALVLRKKIGDVIDLFDGKDLSYQGRIDSLSPDCVEGQILQEIRKNASAATRVTLYQALIKGPKWDWLVEKACEIGASRLVPLLTARTIVKPSRETPLERWKRIALAAAKQCGRTDMMEVSSPIPLAQAFKELPKEGLALIPWEKEAEKTIRQVLKATPHVSLFVGPEGGWEASEVDLAQRHGVLPVKLGKNLLRSETAGMVALAITLSEMGE